jgi:hypothetical protein
MIDGRGVDGNMRVGILLAQMIGGDRAPTPHDVKAAAHNPRPPHFTAVQFAKIAQRRFEIRFLGRGRMGDQ